jgi:hypothetical protein
MSFPLNFLCKSLRIIFYLFLNKIHSGISHHCLSKLDSFCASLVHMVESCGFYLWFPSWTVKISFRHRLYLSSTIAPIPILYNSNANLPVLQKMQKKSHFKLPYPSWFGIVSARVDYHLIFIWLRTFFFWTGVPIYIFCRFKALYNSWTMEIIA